MKIDEVKNKGKRKIIIFYYLIIISVVSLSFINSFKNGFTNWDDMAMVTENTKIRSLSINNIKKIFSTSDCGIYHPVVTLIYALIYKIFRLNANAYHTLNILFHIANSLLVFTFFNLILKNYTLSLIGVLLFAIHPLRVESVAWISETKDVVSCFFFLLSIIFYIKSTNNKISHYIYSILFFIIALLSKPMVVTLPLILIIYEYFIQGRELEKIILNKIPFLLLSLFFSILAVFVQHKYGTIGPAQHFTFLFNIFNSMYGLGFYIFKTVFPAGLSSLYPNIKQLMRIPAVEFIFLLMWTILLTFYLKKDKRITFGFIFFLIAIIPVIQIIPVGEGLPADRYTYIPSIGLSLAVSLILGKIKNKHLYYPLIVLIILFLSYLTFERCKIWKDSFTLWNDVISKYNNLSLAFFGRGNAYLDSGKYNEAILDYNRTLELSPGFSRAYYRRGNAHYYNGDYIQALRDYDNAIKIDPYFVDAYYNRGSIYGNLKDYKKAIEDFLTAIKINSEHVDSYIGIGTVYYNTGDYKSAVLYFNKAIEKDRTQKKAIYARALSYYELGMYKEALNDILILKNSGYNIPETTIEKLKSIIEKK